jgi:hypothetical protein
MTAAIVVAIGATQLATVSTDFLRVDDPSEPWAIREVPAPTVVDDRAAGARRAALDHRKRIALHIEISSVCAGEYFAVIFGQMIVVTNKNEFHHGTVSVMIRFAITSPPDLQAPALQTGNAQGRRVGSVK